MEAGSSVSGGMSSSQQSKERASSPVDSGRVSSLYRQLEPVLRASSWHDAAPPHRNYLLHSGHSSCSLLVMREQLW